MDLFKKCIDFTRVDAIKEAGLYPYFHEITSKQHSEVTMEGRRTIMLGSNNYLGLTVDPRTISAAKEAVDRFGTGCSGSRYLNGTLSLHVEMEKRLARFFRKDDCVSFSTGYQANLGIISALCGRHDVVVSDKLNHASIVDACKLSYAKMLRYDHNDMEDLERQLQKIGENEGILIVVDGVFSMEGDLANLPEIVKLKKRYGARLMVDDSHGIGVMGPGGRGTGEHFGLEDEVDVLMGTFSKSFASLGGFMAANERVANYVRHNSRANIFSASMPPSNVAVVLASLSIVESEPERRKNIMRNAEYMRKGYAKLGIKSVSESQSAVIPVMTYDDERTFRITRELLNEGVYVNPVVSPAVPVGESMLRTSVMATHTLEQLDYALSKFKLVFGDAG